MKCPVCRSHEQVAVFRRFANVTTNLIECPICGTIWSVNHGAVGTVRDAQEKSFLEAVTECVEGDDYFLVA